MCRLTTMAVARAAGAWIGIGALLLSGADAAAAPSSSRHDSSLVTASFPPSIEERKPLLTRTDLLYVLGVSSAVIGTGVNDARLRDETIESNSAVRRTVARMAQPLGNGAIVVPALAAVYLTARLGGATELAAGIRKVSISTGIAGAGALALKEIAGRSRPDEAPDDTDEFRPFSGGRSFPSGHATVAFAMATALDDQTRARWVPWVSYPVAFLVGWSRVRDDRHWTSDVVAGAALGFWTARKVDRMLEDGQRSWPRIGLLPWARSGGGGLELTLRR